MAKKSAKKPKKSAKETKGQKVMIDGTEHYLDKLSEDAKNQINNIIFVDTQIQQLKSEGAVVDTARLGYRHALNNELSQSAGTHS